MANDAPTLTLPRERPRAGEGREGGRIRRVAEALEYGVGGIDEGIISAKSTGDIAPFGSMKESGIGPFWRFTGARNTASRNSAKSNEIGRAGQVVGF
jgi:acyl-CoA reductase-like NAD-dependent aldehyde dehydrogenase